MPTLDKLEMEQIESQYVDTSTLKELEELIWGDMYVFSSEIPHI